MTGFAGVPADALASIGVRTGSGAREGGVGATVRAPVSPPRGSAETVGACDVDTVFPGA